MLSSETIKELVEVLSRKKFDKYLTIEERDTFLTSLLSRGEVIDVTSELQICRDAKDNKFLNLAADGNADLLVTGDDDLLVLGRYQGTKIVNAKAFLDLLNE